MTELGFRPDQHPVDRATAVGDHSHNVTRSLRRGKVAAAL
ncbi:hypothetical protein SJ05684_c33430 [Sinorhizobium sojae CCBAU 05684]|uniref:Uncharacterized protein n=1 Tax=Sinorhizobium sojae CCBAU 05684 TaxID=716928 RepID=A0A249PG81_9HYPH|nr:hypothetical protein SJ05684_c33430 [Sinorhizobium sojae CCBAU 05684]